jgi:hypothetical protein
MTNKIQLTTTPCHLSGVRYWFICPLSVNRVYCGRRTGTLYLASGGKYFGCRYCYKLTYESRNEMRIGRSGGIGYPIVVENKIEDLHQQIKRWTWRGRPTRKARKLQRLERKMTAYEGISVEELLWKPSRVGRIKSL